LYVKKLKLENFRNYGELELEFDKNLNLIIGDNGQGKTNLIEALFVGGFGRSFRTSREREMIQFNSKSAYVGIQFQQQGLEGHLELRFLEDKKKVFRYNGSPLNRLSEWVGHLNVVAFTPEDLKLVKESPSERRRFLDRELSQMSTQYLMSYVHYNRALDQRNALLRTESRQAERYEIWEEKLAEHGAKILLKRFNFVKRLNEISQKIHSDMTNGEEKFGIEYLSSLINENFSDYDKIVKAILKKHEENRIKDIERGYTFYGPHRDDLKMTIDGFDARIYGSQGQQRTAALSLKLSEIEIVLEETGEYPILILDDVMSELDKHRQNLLIRTFDRVQTFITATELGAIQSEHLTRGKILTVVNGAVFENESSGGK
jgi:DNA replication and repair protein RecF